MKILAHIHAYNDADLIESEVNALLEQSYPVDEIIVVDNGSVDGTADRPFPAKVTVIRNPENTGTSGAVATGIKYGMENGFDWIWILDADGKPSSDALEKLVELYQSFSPELQDQVWLLSSLPMEYPRWAITSHASLKLAVFSGHESPQPRHGVLFTDHGYELVKPDGKSVAYPFHGTVWCGCLFKIDAIRKVGLPEADYFLDFGEYAYGYHGMRHGFKAFMHRESIIHHNITGVASLSFTTYRFGPIRFNMVELTPARCYYVARNVLYFWLHVYHRRNFRTLTPRLFKVFMLILNFLLRPISHWENLKACLRGAWHGLKGEIHHRYAR